MNRTTMIRRNPQVVARELPAPDGAVLLHLETGAYHGLNPVGFLVWGSMEEERSVGDVIEAVKAGVEGAPPQIDGDIIAFLEGAASRDLVLVREG